MAREKLRVATWNLDHASNSSRPVSLQIEAILKIAPDILVLTETCEGVNLTPYGYGVEYAQRNEYGKFYAAIWSKCSITSRHETSSPELSLCAQVSTPMGEVLVYGTIITYHGDKGPDRDSPAWVEHYKAIGEQGGDWANLRARFDLPLVVMGDFNQTRDGSSRTYGTKQGRALLTQQLERSRLACRTTANFGDVGKLRADPKNKRIRNNIDHICTSEGSFEVIEVGAWDHFNDEGIYLSDHNGAYVDLRFNPL